MQLLKKQLLDMVRQASEPHHVQGEAKNLMLSVINVIDPDGVAYLFMSCLGKGLFQSTEIGARK